MPAPVGPRRSGLPAPLQRPTRAKARARLAVLSAAWEQGFLANSAGRPHPEWSPLGHHVCVFGQGGAICPWIGKGLEDKWMEDMADAWGQREGCLPTGSGAASADVWLGVGVQPSIFSDRTQARSWDPW